MKEEQLFRIIERICMILDRLHDVPHNLKVKLVDELEELRTILLKEDEL